MSTVTTGSWLYTRHECLFGVMLLLLLLMAQCAIQSQYQFRPLFESLFRWYVCCS